MRGVGTRVRHLMIFGHNPGLSEFAQQLTDDATLGELPTCAVYSVEFEIDKWPEARFGAGAQRLSESTAQLSRSVVLAWSAGSIQPALQQCQVEPAIELAAHFSKQCDLFEAERLVKAD